MPRTRAFSLEEAVQAARDEFWDHGYEGTSLADLERSMGISRSSLYATFGSKRALFVTAFERYIEDVLTPLVEAAEREPAGLDRIASFFGDVRRTFLDRPPTARRGCLLVNSMTELGGAADEAADTIARYRDRLRGAFAHALAGAARSGDLDGGANARRSSMLVAVAFGALLMARFDPPTAIAICDSMGPELDSWRRRSTE